jgi:hypothetical protein
MKFSDLQGDDPTLIDGLTLGDWIDSVAGLIESRPERSSSSSSRRDDALFGRSATQDRCRSTERRGISARIRQASFTRE